MGAIKLIRNLMTGKHRGNTRLWLEPTVLEAAGFQVGDGVQQLVKDGAVIITKSELSERVISRRKRPSWAYERPLFESCSKEITIVFHERQHIDVLVSDGMIVVRKVTSFDLCIIRQPLLQGHELKKLRLYSAPCGGGMATAALVDTGYFEPVGALDVWSTAIDAYIHNFKEGCSYLGDLIQKHPEYVPEADVCWLSPSCTNYSTLGSQTAGITEGHGPHYARIVLASGASVVMIEQVPQYFKSTSYQHLKQLLKPLFPVIHETVIDAHAVGSVASRTREYAVFMKQGMQFKFPQLPKLPEHRRKTVGQVLGKEWEQGNWKSITGTVMEGLLNKNGNNNFKADKNHTLVDLNAKRVSAFPFSYSKIQVTSSYLKHPEEDRWRAFRSDEMLRFLNIPEFYEFPEYMGESDRVKLIGQSVDGSVVKAIGIEVVMAIMTNRLHPQRTSIIRSSEEIRTVIPLDEDNGQYCFQF